MKCPTHNQELVFGAPRQVGYDYDLFICNNHSCSHVFYYEDYRGGEQMQRFGTTLTNFWVVGVETYSTEQYEKYCKMKAFI